MREIIEEVAALLAPLASAKNLELSCFLPSDMPTGVYGDPTRLRQILVNLVGNALKFTSTGEVSINAGLLDCGDGTVRVGIDVTDTGIGMSAATVNNLFSSFMQADTTTTRKFGGTGLGLAISHQLAVLMGGGIDVSSVEGSGSTFSLRLPFGLQTVQDNAEELFVGENVRILIVDDSKTNRLILDHYLTGWGLSHDVAVDGVHGWQLVRQSVQSGQPYTAVLLDLQMPRSDGFELAAKIRADAASANTKIVVVSSSGIEAVHEHPALVDYAVSKPVRQSVLRSILREIVSPETKRQKAPPARTEVGGSEFLGRVLLVEDTFVNRRVGQGMLARLGVEVEVAVDGSDALNVLGEQTFDVVLMDCQMPVMDGFDATRKFRQKEADDAHTYTRVRQLIRIWVV